MNQQTLQILIVDDDDVDIEATKRVLTKQGWDNPVFTAYDGQEALELLRRANTTSRFLILLDIKMPRMDGIEFLQILRNDPALKHHLVFVMTTSRAPKDKRAAHKYKVEEYIIKTDHDEGYHQLVNLLQKYQRSVKTVHLSLETDPQYGLQEAKLTTPQFFKPPAVPSIEELSQETWRILLVEDDDVDQMSIDRMLQQSSLDVDLVMAHNVHDARLFLETNKFDCILLDLGLPDGDGLLLVNEEGNKTPPIIILTGHDDEKLATSAMRQGVQDYLVKDELNARQLQRAIIYAIERDHLRRELHHVKEELQNVVQALEESNVHLAELATIDALTGLHNRRAFDRRLAQLVQEAKRGRPFGLVMLDVDHFKCFNDTFGHPKGDSLLSTLGSWLRENVRAVDYPARYGGEEFAILVVDVTQQEAIALAENLRLSLIKQFEHKTHSLQPITASFGVQVFGAEYYSGTDLIQAADQALYRAKAAGRNRVEPAPQHSIYEPRAS